MLKSLHVRRHPDKTCPKTKKGKAQRGFDFLGFSITSTRIQPSAAIVSRRDANIAQLYEQGASKKRIGQTLRRWIGWSMIGVTFTLNLGIAYGGPLRATIGGTHNDHTGTTIFVDFSCEDANPDPCNEDVTITGEIDGLAGLNSQQLALDVGRYESVWVDILEGTGTSDPTTMQATVNVNLFDGIRIYFLETFRVDLVDNDQDKLRDTWEVENLLDPSSVDTDEDKKLDYDEVVTEDNDTDHDDDGLLDAIESSLKDADNDGVVDEEDPYNLNKCIPNACELSLTPPQFIKNYDGNTTATTDGAFTLSGIDENNTDVTLEEVTRTYAYSDATVGVNIEVTPTPKFTLIGSDASNYTLVQPTITGTINKASQEITQLMSSPTSPVYEDNGTFQVNAIGGNSGEPVTYSVDSNNDVCEVKSGSTIKILQAGTCTVKANQGGNTNYEAAEEVSIDINIKIRIADGFKVFKESFEGTATPK